LQQQQNTYHLPANIEQIRFAGPLFLINAFLIDVKSCTTYRWKLHK